MHNGAECQERTDDVADSLHGVGAQPERPERPRYGVQRVVARPHVILKGIHAHPSLVQRPRETADCYLIVLSIRLNIVNGSMSARPYKLGQRQLATDETRRR